MLRRRRAGLDRLEPGDAHAAHGSGALLVDTRPVVNRAAEGVIPGAVVIDRNVLEWRLDPTSPDRIPEAADADLHVILFCNEGYASSLAAAQLRELGLRRATDMVGGFRAWVASGLPVEQGEATGWPGLPDYSSHTRIRTAG
nr:rhodanese-like domain-containing protein [Nocardiopsis mwathae]